MNLAEVTDLSVIDVLKKDIVLPSQYQKTFERHAVENNVAFHDDAFVDNYNEESMRKANELIQSANKNIVKLSDTTKSAQDAIKDKDHEKLLSVSEEVAKLRHEMDQLKSRVYKDPLTNINNRLWISDIYLHGKDTFQNDGILVFIDLDRFKFINDTYGHNVGDKVLIYVSRYLAKEFHALNLIRFAGDEFILLGSDNDTEALNIAFEKSRYELTQKKIKAVNGDLLHLNFSFGIAAFNEGDSYKAIVEKADVLMYENKQSRRKE